METLKELKAIRDNAPEGASHVNYAYYFKKQYDSDWMYCEINKSHWEFDDDNAESDMRSLSDINRIIELMEQVKASYEAYSRIESVKQQCNAENKQIKELLKDITENEDLDDCRFLAVEKALENKGDL